MKMIKHKAPPLLQLKTKHAKFSNRIKNKYESKVDLYLGKLSLVFREGVANEDPHHTYAFQSLFHSFFIKKFFAGTVSPTFGLKNNQYSSLFRTINFENKPEQLSYESNLLSQINKAIMFTKLLSIQSSSEYFNGYKVKAPFPWKKGAVKQVPAYEGRSSLFPSKWVNQFTYIENVKKPANVLNNHSNFYRMAPFIATKRGKQSSKFQHQMKERFLTVIKHELERSWNKVFSANVLAKKMLQKEQLKEFNSRLSKTLRFTAEHLHKEDNDTPSAKFIVIEEDLFNWNFNIHGDSNVLKSGNRSKRPRVSIGNHLQEQRSFSLAHWQPTKTISKQQFLFRKRKREDVPLQVATKRGKQSNKFQHQMKERFLTFIEHELERSWNEIFSTNVLAKKLLQKEQLKAFNSKLSKAFRFTIEHLYKEDNDAPSARSIVIEEDLFNWNFNIYKAFNVLKGGKGSDKRKISIENHLHEQRLFTLAYLQPGVLERLFSAKVGRPFSLAYWQPTKIISKQHLLLRKRKREDVLLQLATKRSKQSSKFQHQMKERFLTFIEHELERSWSKIFSANVLAKKLLQKEQLKAFNSRLSKTFQFTTEHLHKEDNDAPSAESFVIEADLFNWGLNVKNRKNSLVRFFLHAKNLAKTKFLFNKYSNEVPLLQTMNSQLVLSRSGMKHDEQLRKEIQPIQLDLERKKQQGETAQFIKKKFEKRYLLFSEQALKRERSRIFLENLFAKTLLQQQNGEFHFRLQRTLEITPERKHDKDSDAKTSKVIAVERLLSVQNLNVKKIRSVLGQLRKHSLLLIAHWQPPPLYPKIITEKQSLKLTSARSNNKAKRFLRAEPRMIQHLLKNDELQTFINEDILHVATILLEKQVTHLLKKASQQMNLMIGTKGDKPDAKRRISTTIDEQQRFQLHKQTTINNVQIAQLNRMKLDRKLVGDHLLHLTKLIHLPYLALKLPIERIKQRQYKRALPCVKIFTQLKEPFNEDVLYKRTFGRKADGESFALIKNVSSEQFLEDDAFVSHLVKNTKLGQRADEKAANVLSSSANKNIFLRSTTERTRTVSEYLQKKRLKSYAEINKSIARQVKNITRQHQLVNRNLMTKESRFTEDFSAVSLQFRQQGQELNDSFQRPMEMSHYKPAIEKSEVAKIQKIVKQMIDNEQKKLKNEEKQTSSFLEININQVVEQIYVKLNRKINFEQQRRGL